MPLADFGARLAAYLIDALLLAVVTLIIAVPIMILVMTRVTRFAPEPTQDDPGAAFRSASSCRCCWLEAGLFWS